MGEGAVKLVVCYSNVIYVMFHHYHLIAETRPPLQ